MFGVVIQQVMSFMSAAESPCPIARAAALVGDTWTILIVRDLMGGARRFGALQQSLGAVSPKTLSQRLKFLEAEGIVSRQAFPEIPPRVEYNLTEKGQALSEIMEALRLFGERYLALDEPILDAS
jgi:DNA-binding HxlR family transcriptional regulator